jgi:phosphate-selective porin OprO and OprP
MDLNDAGFTGGEQRNITLGLNHYITSRLRFMGNLVFVNVDYLEENPVLLVIRAQFSF